MKNKLIKILFSIEFIRESVIHKSDLEAFKRKPDARIISGVSLIILSYIIGWPLISALGFLAYHFKEKYIIILGGPAVYGLSHLTFMLGMYLAGAKYSVIFLRWFTYRGIKLLTRNDDTLIERNISKYMTNDNKALDKSL
jgi:hypothetical protein